MIDNHRKG